MAPFSLNRRRGSFSPTYPAKAGLFHQASNPVFTSGDGRVRLSLRPEALREPEEIRRSLSTRRESA
jgi:hypothetical protein